MGSRQTRAFATIYRYLGWLYIAGLAYWLLSGDFKRIPIWATACLLLASVLLIRRAFKISQRFTPPRRDDDTMRTD